ncbi:uncharacterized protein V6R79_009357 [Siganus canaliculatus]
MSKGQLNVPAKTSTHTVYMNEVACLMQLLKVSKHQGRLHYVLADTSRPSGLKSGGLASQTSPDFKRGCLAVSAST